LFRPFFFCTLARLLWNSCLFYPSLVHLHYFLQVLRKCIRRCHHEQNQRQNCQILESQVNSCLSEKNMALKKIITVLKTEASSKTFFTSTFYWFTFHRKNLRIMIVCFGVYVRLFDCLYCVCVCVCFCVCHTASQFTSYLCREIRQTER